jgi:hypothetical protein
MSLADAMAGVRCLVGCGNDELWYEDIDVAYGTMTKLTASDGDIDTSDNLTPVPAFQKVVILNGANKKIFDRTDSKIATDSVGSHPPDYDTVLTGGTSGAKMVAHYATSLSGACTIYGYRKTTATFTSGETVTGTDDDGNAISFVLNADEVTPSTPHWYDFTPFGNDSSFGTLPDKLYLGALYLGRLYLAGNPDNPYEWQASRQGNIFDFKFNEDDVQSACSGSDVEFGKIGDIIRTMVQFENDYLIFGCQSSIYALIGDPMQGGSAKRVPGSEGIGIFGARSRCFDTEGNLWFWGPGGIYKLHRGLAGIEHMTEYRLPRIVHDENVDPTTHRITMGYDLKRHGIVVAITNLSTRVNSAYWYERRAGAWYPEQYPEECAPYSMVYYNAQTVANRDMLVGCADGYIRRFDDDEKDDDIGATDEAIDSYITFGPFAMSEDLGGEGIVSNVYGILAGGASGGSESDSSDVTYYVYVGDSPEEVMEKVSAGTYVISGTVYAPGYQKGKKQRKRARGKYAAVRLRNNTSGQTWGFEEIEVEVEPAGRLS